MRSLFTFLWSWLKQLFDRFFGNRGGDVPDPTDPIIDEPMPDEPYPGEIVDYYGCPNSKRAQKLQLKQKLYR